MKQDRRWTEVEVELLKSMRGSGYKVRYMGVMLNRRKNSVAGKIYRLKLPLVCPKNAYHVHRRRKV